MPIEQKAIATRTSLEPHVGGAAWLFVLSGLSWHLASCRLPRFRRASPSTFLDKQYILIISNKFATTKLQGIATKSKFSHKDFYYSN
jgi:hypothetical protein